MDLFEFIEDEFDEYLLNHIMRPRRRRVIRNRPDYFTELDETDFRTRFRLSKPSVTYVLSLIEGNITTMTNLNFAISPMNRLLLTLRYYATGSFLITSGDFSGISKASASRIISNVSRAIAELRPGFVKFPINLQPVKEGIYNIARFPKVIGTIDCTHVNIKSPGGETAEYYRNRKGNFSINVQTIVDSDLKIMDIVARWPGSCHDQSVFNNSQIKHRLINNEFGNNFLLGDKGYENTKYLLTPLHNPVTQAEHLYNESQIRTRNTVERSYGVWKNRFPVLSRKITLHLTKVQAIIVACAVLHNIAIISGDENFDMNELPADDDDDYVYTDTGRNNGNSVRNNIIAEYFTSLLN